MLMLYCEEINGRWYGAALDGKRIFATTFASSRKEAMRYLLNEIPYNMHFQEAEKPDVTAEELFKVMEAIIEGKDVSFSFEFAMETVSPYNRRVLEVMALIPTGYVTTYSALAKVVGGHARAVGRACATNPFPPVIPCHRVVSADMSLGGYGGGLKTKWAILKREDRGYKDVSKVKIGGKILPLYPVKHLHPPT
ncbi:MAG: methylated-DNA--[protein]-cysteine S-methyltransferase [Candidatus Bathyarchaeia archaeon]|jgi:O-6-methylguanine DNA methyltransferase|nr:methylated-DNA--[protein]-cysteine S-methyltransferase [Candidatus Bathyarchaeota archaeon A05DMB-4]MDH7595709.1 methylated-DNA--[protein]-cysteine S-methyltransferase [Candidatus Bathyarchaeota archaeon]